MTEEKTTREVMEEAWEKHQEDVKEFHDGMRQEDGEAGKEEKDQEEVAGEEESSEDLTPSETPAGEDEGEGESAPDEGETPSWTPGDIEPIHSWPEDVKADFVKQPAEVQRFAMDTYKGMQADYTRKTQAVADMVRALEPIQTELVHSGVTPADAIRRFVGAHVELQQDPRNAILRIMENYGISFQQLLDEQGNAPAPASPEAQRLQQIEQQQRLLLEQQQRAHIEAQERAVEEFRKDKPYFDAVQGRMQRIFQVAQMTGQQPPTLQEAYDDACWSDPAVREKILAQRAADTTRQSQRETARAKNAAGSIEGSTAASAEDAEKPRSLREEIQRAAQQVEGKRAQP